MSKLTVNDRKETLLELENQFRQDLAVHLYSAVLLKRIDPTFPKPRWTSWPLPDDQTPIPKSTKKYNDVPFGKESFSTDIDRDTLDWKDIDYNWKIQQYELKHKPLPKFLSKHKQKGDNSNKGKDKVSTTSRRINFDDMESDNLDSFEVESESEIEVSGDEIYTTNWKQKIEDFQETESVTNSKVELLNEIHAIIEKKIQEKISKTNGLTMTSDAVTDVTKKMSKIIALKIDTTIDNLADMPLPKLIIPVERKNWQNVFLASIDSFSPYQTYNTTRLQQLYDKFDNMFHQVKYNYEFEDSDEDEIISSTGFDVAKYLSQLAQDNPKYTKINDTYFERKHQQTVRYQGLDTVIKDRLKTLDSYNKLNWNNHKYRSIIPPQDNLDGLKARILDPQQVAVGASSYLLGKQFVPKRKKQKLDDVDVNEERE